MAGTANSQRSRGVWELDDFVFLPRPVRFEDEDVGNIDVDEGDRFPSGDQTALFAPGSATPFARTCDTISPVINRDCRSISNVIGLSALLRVCFGRYSKRRR